MFLKFKIMGIVALTSLLLFSAITASQYVNLNELAKEQIETSKKEIKNNVKEMIKNNVCFAIKIAEFIIKDSKEKGLEKEDIEELVINTLSSIRYGEKKDGYFFAYKQDEKGNTYFAFHSIKKHLNGKKTDIYKPGIKGIKFRAKLIEVAKRGGGFVAYWYKKPSTGKIIQKIAYAKKLPYLNWYIVTGAYLDDVERVELQIENKIKEQIENLSINNTIIFIVVTFIITFLVSLVANRFISKPVIKLKEAQQDAEYRAQHDSLTDLYNRQKLIEELERVYKHSEMEGEYSAFLFFDLDNFKYINDYYNHEIGDKVLIEISKRLRNVVCENDILARVAGDEFTLITCNLGKDKSEAIKKASILTEKIKAIFEDPIEIDGNHIEVTFSTGVKIFPDQEKSYKEVMVNADIAMYHAKKNGKNQFHIFNERLNLESKQFLLIKNELSEAIRKGELILHYQPKVSVKTGKIVGFEALVRWLHPERGLLYPDQFLYVTAGNSLSFDLGEYVLETACKQINIWRERWVNFDKKISINISGEQFNNKNFTQSIIKIIEKYNMDPIFLDFEIVEDALLKDIDSTIEVIKIFKKLGVTFSMDDFGTGYSSMNYLKNLPVDILKIDKSFILDLFEEKNIEIVKMIIDTAKIFNLKVVAEGVENEESLKYLNSCGCDYYQGYYFSKPISVEEATKMLEKENTKN